ncbi:MAG: nitroreductase family protein [Muricomes sp.]
MKQDIIDFLSERNSIRNFDSHYIIPVQDINKILSLASKAPSGNNTQPWKVVTIKNKELQKQLQSLAFNQKQLETASAIFIVFGDPYEYNIVHLIDYKIHNENLSPERAAEFGSKMENFYEISPTDKGAEGLKLDCGLFSMNLLYSIRAYEYDAVPMRGVNFDKLKELLKIPYSWIPILMIPFGKAIETGNQKTRKSIDKFSILIE